MNTSKKNILVPVDFSDQSLIALQYAEGIAQTTSSDLFLLYVHSEQSMLSSIFSNSDSDEKAFDQAWEKLGQLALDVEKRSGVKATALVAKGKVSDEIIQVSELVGSTFIIMGTNGSDSFVRRFVGSNALKVVRESRIPVFSIKGKPAHTGFRQIVLPLDLTKETREKVKLAITFSRYFNAEVKVVSILMTDDEEVISRLEFLLNQVEAFLTEANVKCSAELVKVQEKHEDLGEEVLKYAERVGGDLIMIMTQQENDFKDMFIGSAAQTVINNSGIPVCSIIPNYNRTVVVFRPY
jgi:nucleotide-binding universal stress UspA family protein